VTKMSVSVWCSSADHFEPANQILAMPSFDQRTAQLTRSALYACNTQDWNDGRIPFYTVPPSRGNKGFESASVVGSWAQDFNAEEVCVCLCLCVCVCVRACVFMYVSHANLVRTWRRTAVQNRRMCVLGSCHCGKLTGVDNYYNYNYNYLILVKTKQC